MKIKQDFVTNSSSVCFFFLFKGRQEKDLFPILRKYEQYFRLISDNITNYSCNVEDIIDDIKNLKKNKDYYSEHLVCPTKIISELEKVLDSLKRYDEKDIGKKYSKKYNNYIRILKNGMDKKMMRCLRASWGDNNGDFNGRTGCCMDYENGELYINEDDLIVFTINEH